MNFILKILLLVLFFKFLPMVIANGQNLIPNPSFELSKKSPLERINNLPFTRYWDNPTIGSPEILYNYAPLDINGTSISINCRSGEYCCRLAIFSEFNVEYISSKLRRNLLPRNKYHVELWVKYFDQEILALPQGFGLKFNDGKENSTEMWLKGNPDIHLLSDQKKSKDGWLKISGIYTPISVVSQLTIGHFLTSSNNDESFNYNILIDDVSIVKISDEVSHFPNIQFAKNNSNLLKNSVKALNKLVYYLIINDKDSIEIQGHTDSEGSVESNLQLSEKRVASVSTYLIRNGIPSNRIIPKYFGEKSPIRTSNTESAKAKNRRVEIKIVKL